MISHGFVSGAMFLCIGVLYDRVHSREIADYGGVVNTMPKFAAFAVLFAMANCGLPGTAGFVGEWMVILGAVKANFWLGVAGRHGADLRRGLHAVDGQARVLRRGRQRRTCAQLTDINAREFLMLALLAVAVLSMGVYPEAVHRRDARVGGGPAPARGHVQTELSTERSDDAWTTSSLDRRLRPRSCCWSMACVDRAGRPVRHRSRSAHLHLLADAWRTLAVVARAAPGRLRRRRPDRLRLAGAWWSATRWATCSSCFATLAMMVHAGLLRAPTRPTRDMLRGGEFFTLALFALLGIIGDDLGEQLPGRSTSAWN